MREDSFRALSLNRDFHKERPAFKDGELYIVQDLRYDIDTQNWKLVLEKIGNPVDKGWGKIDIVYK